MVNGEPCAPRGACTVLEGVSNAGLPHDLDVDVARLRLMKADHQSQQYRLEDRLLKHFPQEIERNQGFLRGLEQDHATVEAHPLPEQDFVGMTIDGAGYTEAKAPVRKSSRSASMCTMRRTSPSATIEASTCP